MDFDKIIATSEKYVREFILYLLSFFWNKADHSEESIELDDLNRSAIFAIFSTLVGSYIWNRYVLGRSGKPEDLVGILADNILNWISIGLLLYVIMKMLRIKVHIILPVLGALKVLSVSHVIANYAAYIAINIIDIFITAEKHVSIATLWSFRISYFLELLLLWIYLPREIRTICVGAPRWRVYAASIAILPIVTMVVLIPYSDYICGTQGC